MNQLININDNDQSINKSILNNNTAHCGGQHFITTLLTVGGQHFITTLLTVGVNILVTCRKHLHDCIISLK